MSKIISFIFLIAILFAGCTTPQRTIISLSDSFTLSESMKSKSSSIVVGRMKPKEKLTGLTVLPSFSISDTKGNTVYEVDNTGLSVTSGANEMITFWFELPPGKYFLNRYWWGLPETKGKLGRNLNEFSIEPGIVNYIGDIIVKITEVSSHSASLRIENIENNIEEIKEEKKIIVRLDIPVKANLLH